MARRPVDFDRLKSLTFEQTIAFLNLKLYAREGQQLRFPCPACGSDPNNRDSMKALSIHPDKGFRCFKGHQKVNKGDDAVALVAHVRKISQYDAGSLLESHFFGHASPGPAQAEPEGGGELKPLDYLEHSHPVAEMLGFSAATLEALGGGYAPKGTMFGRLLIPLRMEDGRLVGYFGIATKTDQEPLLQFPNNLEERCTAAVEVATEPQQSPYEIRKLFRIVS